MRAKRGEIIILDREGFEEKAGGASEVAEDEPIRLFGGPDASRPSDGVVRALTVKMRACSASGKVAGPRRPLLEWVPEGDSPLAAV